MRKMRKKQGFTLIELLAVIIILSIIALITVPLILGVISKVRISAYKESLKNIFPTVNLYLASNDFMNFPDEGIDVTSDMVPMEHKNFISGKIIKNELGQLELKNVSNGIYCGVGIIDNIKVIKGDCNQLDETAPMLEITSGLITSSSITIIAIAEDNESGISSYEYSIDDGEVWTSKEESSSHTFTGLTNNTNYILKVKATNNNNLTTISDSLVVTTNDIETPVYTINTTEWAQEAIVTIHYPERETGYIYEYSLDECVNWIEVENPSTNYDITFNENGIVIARISDGTNIISGTSYAVTNIDKTAPIITIDSTSIEVYQDDIYVDSGIIGIDNEEGNITEKIVTTGIVDTSTLGTYILKYNLTDTAGNIASEVTRTVTVVAKYICLIGTLVNDSTYGYICTVSASSQNWIGSNYVCTATKTVPVYETYECCTYTCEQNCYDGWASTGFSEDYGYDACVNACWIGSCITWGTCTRQNGTKEVCTDGYSYSYYYCATGWNTYSGSGNSLVCYQEATKE